MHRTAIQARSRQGIKKRKARIHPQAHTLTLKDNKLELHVDKVYT